LKASASLVRCEINRRAFSASPANRFSMKGSAIREFTLVHRHEEVSVDA
jgi:hypothetical protein